ncbi:hypothetical protein [Hymenobacter terricola]|uniref:hypothetical protein n=1 Tax=Hymenobacter terricola TaxID=2819236 RepID=UPI001B300EEB|nr:hypothetical protein [Hymenobacter terricola]
MDPKNNHSLENFVERHRADFDTHEPRPDLWAALEQQLAETKPEAIAPTMRLADPAGPEPAKAAGVAPAPARTGWFQRYGVAAALALLVFAAGASEAWKSNRQAPELAVAASATGAGTAAGAPDAALYQGGAPLALTATERTTGADSQLVRAVRGMEAYYTNQLARRQSELRQLNGPGMAAMTADWQRELVSLDSSYRKLKLELPHHPQPDAVLTAMNRNLQIRLDILDQQLHLGTAPATDPNSGAYVLADSRRLPE